MNFDGSATFKVFTSKLFRISEKFVSKSAFSEELEAIGNSFKILLNILYLLTLQKLVNWFFDLLIDYYCIKTYCDTNYEVFFKLKSMS